MGAWALLLLLSLYGFGSASHFRGAIIQWKPVDAVDYDGRIEITHRISWRNSRSEAGCDQSDIDSQSLLGSNGGSLVCRAGCSGTVGVMSYYCTDFSTSEDWATGERSYVYDATTVSYFEASFKSCCWISLVIGGQPSWEVRVKGNLTQREDTGRINSSPVSAISPIVRLQHGCNHTFEIPVEDVDGDIIRCRWAESSQEECGGTCSTFPATLSQCTLIYEATGSSGYYGVAIQIEDFATDTSTVPLSSVPLQFLVLVYSANTPCSSQPEFVGTTRLDQSCIGVPFNTTYHEQIIVQAGGEGVSITEIPTVSPPGVQKSDLAPYGHTLQWYVNITWTPIESQYGPNIFCFSAVDSVGLTSPQRCVTLLGGVEPPIAVPGSLTPTGEIFPNHTQWSLRFDKEFHRPTAMRFIQIYTESGTRVISIDVTLSSSPVTYPSNDLGRELTFTTDYLFVEKRSYYVLLDPGVAVGPEFCGPESPALRDPNYWAVRIADITPPTLSFVVNPSLSNENVTISWHYDEEASSYCILQTPTELYSIPCNSSMVVLHYLSSGRHTLYVQGTDIAGNVAESVRHSWIVDLTPPHVRLTSLPSSVTQETQWTLSFYCTNENSCTYECSLHIFEAAPLYTACSGSFHATDLQNGDTYEFAVIATDAVGNIGGPYTYHWIVDTMPPTLSLEINSIVLSCGDDYSPSVTGYPTVVDNEDTDPFVEYTDNPSSECTIIRNWTATDNAGNQASVIQTIYFTSPLPPQIISPSEIAIPCGSVEDAIETLGRADLTVIHPCGRQVVITFSDSANVSTCGITFTRTWVATDDCGSSNTFQQTIRVLDQQHPDSPVNGELNVDLNSPLTWPQYPGAYSYEVYVWMYGNERPNIPAAVVNERQYEPSNNYPPGTRLLWQIEYITGANSSVPSPVWGFMTQPYPDLLVMGVTIPDYAFSGQEFDVQWTVINQGNISTDVYYWYDAVYIGHTTNFLDSRRVLATLQNRLIDPEDGYVDEARIQLENDDIGNFYVFVVTDVYEAVSDIDRNNNRKRSSAPLEVTLTPPPNLVIDTVVVPTSTFSGQSISVRWTVRNTGVGPTAVTTWFDQLFWSNTADLGPDAIRLGTYVHSGVLTAGAFYTRTEDVGIPNAIYGNFTIIAITDSGNYVFEYTDEDDNTQIALIDVILAPPPDLVVSHVGVNDEYFTGDTMVVQYTISNIGAGDPFENYWRDRLILVSLSSGSQFVLAETTHYFIFDSAFPYTNEVMYTIPPGLPSGLYNITAITDFDNNVFEFTFDGNNFYSKTIRIEEQVSNLVVTNLTASVITDSEGNQLQVNYTVTNNGVGPTLNAPWSDTIAISTFQTFSLSTSTRISGVPQHTNIMADESYSQYLEVSVPSNIFGVIYLHLVADSNNRIVEDNESDNVYTFGPFVVSPVFPDISVENLVLIDGNEITAGSVLRVNYTITNEGNGLVNKMRNDQFYLSVTSEISSAVLQLGDISAMTFLQPGEHYTQTLAIQVPSYLFGSYHFLVRVNAGGNIDENGRLDNNLASTQLYLSVPPSPDFIVVDIEYSYIQSQRLLTVTWAVANEGNSMTVEQQWEDAILLSLEDHSSAIRLGDADISVLLQSSQVYQQSATFVIPASIDGLYYIRVEVDSGNDVMEVYGENNNVRSSDAVLEISPQPSIQLNVSISENIPNILLAGQSFIVHYEVFNTGEVDSSTRSWVDALYLTSTPNADRDTIIQNGILLKHIVNNRQLLSGESYSVSENISVPYSVNEALYLVVVIDIGENLADASQIEGSLYTSAMNPVLVEDGPLSDLTIVSLSENITLRGGEPASLLYEVLNSGENSALGVWYEAIYLSVDIALDAFDIKLKSIANKHSLNINESYSQSAEVFIPYDLRSGAYYLFFRVDVSNHLSETNETNNIAHSVVSIQETVSTDLIVASVTTSPVHLEYEDDLNFLWQVRNNGTLEATGYKCDTAYISRDEKWDITDYQLGSPQCGSIVIQPYEGDPSHDLSYLLTEATPFLAQQDYTGIVRTRSNIRDLNLENNIGYADTMFSINAPHLELGVPTAIMLTPGGEKVYRIEGVPSEHSLIATLTVFASDSPYHDLLLRYKQPATGFSHDAFSQKALSMNQRAVVRSTKSGVYYLSIESNGVGEDSYEVEVLVKIAVFEILEISPAVAAPLGNVTIFFSGTLFSNQLEALLINESAPHMTQFALSIYWLNSEEVYATFDATSLGVGTYSVQLVDTTTGALASLNNSLRIEPGIPGQLSVSVRPPRPLRPGAAGKIELYVRNSGNTDLVSPILTLNGEGNALFRNLDDIMSDGFASEINFLLLPSKGPGGILPPGGSAQVTFNVTTVPGFAGREKLSISSIEEDAEPHPYVSQKEDLKPPELPDRVWDTIWSNFLESVGMTWRTYRQRVSEVATELSLIQRKVYSAEELLNYQLRIAYGLETGDILLNIEDIGDGLTDSSLSLALRREYSSFIYKRRTTGPLGTGWIVPWLELRVQNISSESVQLWSGRGILEFSHQGGAVYGDSRSGTLITADPRTGVFYEDPQDEVVYKFDYESGLLLSISSTEDDGLISVGYDSFQQPMIFSHSNGFKMRISYDEDGLISYVDILDGNNNVVKSSLYSYSSTGTLLLSVTVGGSTTEYNYNEEGDLIHIFYASGSKKTFQYNSNSLLSLSEHYSISGELLSSVTFLHNWNGKLTVIHQPENITRFLWFDTTGEIIATEEQGAMPIFEVHTADTSFTRIVFGDQVVSESYFDSSDNILYQTNANGNQLTYSFGENEELETLTDSEGKEYSLIYNDAAQINRVENPDGTIRNFDYDDIGNLISVVNPDGTTIEYTYDTSRNLISKVLDSGQVSYEYDSRNRLTHASNEDGRMEISFDDRGLPQRITYPNGHSLFYHYNSRRQRVSLTDNSGLNVTYCYDERYRLSKILLGESADQLAEFEYNNNGQLLRKSLGNGAFTMYTYVSGTRRLSWLKNYFPNSTLQSRFEYTYDNKQRITKITTTEGDWRYWYDATGQLVGWTDPSGLSTEYRYDSRGNRVTEKVEQVEVSYSVNDINQYVTYNDTSSFTFDGNGNLIEKVSNGKSEEFSFNPEGKLTVARTSLIRCMYHYDALGNLYRKNCSDGSDYQYLVDPFGTYGADIVAEISDQGVTHFVHSLEYGLIAAANLTDGLKYYHLYDGDGSVVSILNSEGETENSYAYNPFGKILHQSERIRNIYLYIGKFGVVCDKELQSMFMMRARHYDAQHGRYISLDPAGLAGNSPNLYTYAHNSPLLVKDPRGRVIPLLIFFGATVYGAYGGVGDYILSQGPDATLGGAVGSAVKGGLNGFGSVLLIPGADNVIAVIADVANAGIQMAIDDQSVDIDELARVGYESIIDQIPNEIPGLDKVLKKILKKKLRFFKPFIDEVEGKVVMKFKDHLKNLPIPEVILEWIRSIDPNDMIGPNGYGGAHFIPPDLTLEYTIRFENDPNATAPAQKVLIRHHLDEDLDIRTFRIGSFGFGDFTSNVTQGMAFLQDTVNVTDSHGVFVRITAGINTVTSEATWILQALDPLTGEPPVDPSIGFLPPNNGTNGQGFVSFTVRVKQGVESMTRINAEAEIIFDQNEPIATPPIFNTIDATAPSVNLSVIPELLLNGTLAVRLQSYDAESGVQTVDVYHLTGDVGAQPLVVGSQTSIAILNLPQGFQYQIFASAVDNVGNQRPFSELMQNAMLIDFPVFEAVCHNNCSERGNCTTFGTCSCSPGYYGSDCSRDTPPIEPPVLEMYTPGGQEDTPVLVTVSAKLPGMNRPPDGLMIQMHNLPEGFTFNKGIVRNNSWVLNSSEFGEVYLSLPDGFSGSIQLEGTAVYLEASKQGSLQFNVEPIADPPNLAVEPVCYTPPDDSITLTIQSSLLDNDGSETLSLIIQVPENYDIPNGVNNGSGVFIVTYLDLENLEIKVADFEPTTLMISAVSLEQQNQDTAHRDVSISVQYCDVNSTTTPTNAVTETTEFYENQVILIGGSVGVGVILIVITACLLTCCICCCKRCMKQKYVPGDDDETEHFQVPSKEEDLDVFQSTGVQNPYFVNSQF